MEPSPLLPVINRLSGVRLLCIGDLMLDRFIYGSVDRISPEAPIPVFSMERESRMLGGAGNVVRNLLALDAEATFLAVVGDDSVGKQLTGLVGAEPHLTPYLLSEQGRISTKKTRYVAGGQQLLRSDHETRQPLAAATTERLIELLTSELPGQQAVILSDYGKGVLSPALVAKVMELAAAARIPVFVPRLSSPRRHCAASTASAICWSRAARTG